MSYRISLLRGVIFGLGFSIAIFSVLVVHAVNPGVVKNPTFTASADDVVVTGAAACAWSGWYCASNPCSGDWINSDDIYMTVLDSYCDPGRHAITQVKYFTNVLW